MSTIKHLLRLHLHLPAFPETYAYRSARLPVVFGINKGRPPNRAKTAHHNPLYIKDFLYGGSDLLFLIIDDDGNLHTHSRVAALYQGVSRH